MCLGWLKQRRHRIEFRDKAHRRRRDERADSMLVYNNICFVHVAVISKLSRCSCRALFYRNVYVGTSHIVVVIKTARFQTKRPTWVRFTRSYMGNPIILCARFSEIATNDLTKLSAREKKRQHLKLITDTIHTLFER